MTGLLTRIREQLDDFSGVERRIADYLISNPHDILKLSIIQIAEQTNSSSAGIVRFCQKIGFDGYKSVKSALAHDLIQSFQTLSDDGSYSDISPSDSARNIIDKVFSNQIRAIEETGKMLDIAAFEDAIALLDRAHRIDIFGFGASGLVAQDMQQKLIRIGKYSFAYADVHLQFTAASSLTPDDAAVFISYSGKTRDIISCMRYVKELGVKIIAITKSGSSRVATLADIVLRVCSPEIAVRSGAMSSRIIQLAIVDMLFMGVAGKHYEQTQKSLRRSSDSVRNMRYL
ncbi:MAG: MurR/RpiR family transcriptional regulator [Treponema sp.]|jgi:DNA-binding MurR/RpiR family transcriptional regulator|nr:MurR/RpiR family transcriptional regulator [Treponema sp.]